MRQRLLFCRKLKRASTETHTMPTIDCITTEHGKVGGIREIRISVQEILGYLASGHDGNRDTRRVSQAESTQHSCRIYSILSCGLANAPT